MREVTISPVLNGWIVRVGCQTLVYDDKSDLLRDFVAFLEDPVKTERRIVETAVNRQITMPGMRTPAMACEDPGTIGVNTDGVRPFTREEIDRAAGQLRAESSGQCIGQFDPLAQR